MPDPIVPPSEGQQQQQQQQTPPDAPAAQNQDQGQGSKAQTRINQLYGQKKQAEERVSLLESQNENLRTQLIGIQEQLSLLREQPRPTSIDPYNLAAAQNNSGAGNLSGQIEAAVQKAVGPFFTQMTEQRKAHDLFQQQAESWQLAAQDEPGLKDKNSEVYRASQQIWENDPYLKGHPRGPYLAAMAARGMMSAAPSPFAPQQQQARAASVTPSIGGGQSVQHTDDLGKLEQQYLDVKNKLNEGGDPVRYWPELRKLQNKIADIRDKQPKTP